MPVGSSNFKLKKQDFVVSIETLQAKMEMLQDVIQRYGEAKSSLDMFVDDTDVNYTSIVETIDVHIMNAKNAWTSLQEMKKNLEKTVDYMDDMSNQLKETIDSAKDATLNTVKATIRVNNIL